MPTKRAELQAELIFMNCEFLWIFMHIFAKKVDIYAKKREKEVVFDDFDPKRI